MATLKFYNKAGQLVELTGVNGLRATKSDGTKLTYIAPSGKLNITDMAVKDVTNYAQAQIVDANLVPENIKKDVTILGRTGTFEGGSSGPTNYVTFTAQQANSTIKIEIVGSLSPITLFYSINNTNWQPYTINTVITLTNIGDYVNFYGVGNWRASYSSLGYLHFVMTGKIAGSGNGNALLDAYTDATVTYCCYNMFQNCTALTAAPDLPATTAAGGCYNNMFVGCTSLTSAPDLPATTLGDACYSNMFRGCTALAQASELPATTAPSYCYNQMFQDCISLTTAPDLPATTLANNCYTSMFQGCSALTQAPELPATTLASNCYQRMFSGCSALTQASELPATTLAMYCYEYMFSGCAALTAAPELPATTLATYCYEYMFDGCTALTQAPSLPATTLASNCYSYMFRRCRALTQAPALPATTLVSNCYNSMFSGCSALTQAPELPATTMANKCYYEMFYNCTLLASIKTAVVTWNTSYALRWLSGVASSGTVYCPADSTIPEGPSGVPFNWSRAAWTPAA